MATIIPNHAAQMRPLALSVTPGVDSYRVAYVGGATFDVAGAFSDGLAAYRAMRSAKDATDALLVRVFSGRSA